MQSTKKLEILTRIAAVPHITITTHITPTMQTKTTGKTPTTSMGRTVNFATNTHETKVLATRVSTIARTKVIPTELVTKSLDGLRLVL